MDLELDGRVVVITGGSDGLGAGLARRLVLEGAAVALCARGADRLERTASELVELGGEVLHRALDVTEPGAVEDLVDETARRFGRLDGLVNNAGAAAGSAFESIDDEAWDADLDLKLHAAVRATRAALPHLRTHGGSVLNVLASAAKAPPARSMPSSVSRAAGMAMTKALANEVAADGVRVNSVLIGLIESDQWRRMARRRETDVDEMLADLSRTAGVPLGRVGRTEEFADVAAFLLSVRASYVTGTALNIDGGLNPVV